MPATSEETPARLTDAQVGEVLALARDADSVELKLTVPDSHRRQAATALGVDPLDAQIRQVYFFDTPQLTLNKAGIVARARRIQGRDSDSVIKLRPIVPDHLPPEVRQSQNCVVELDAMPGGYVCSASLKGRLAPTAVRSAGIVMPKTPRMALPSTPKTRRMPVAISTPRVAMLKRSFAVLFLVSAAKMKAMSATPTVANKVASATRKLLSISVSTGQLDARLPSR